MILAEVIIWSLHFFCGENSECCLMVRGGNEACIKCKLAVRGDELLIRSLQHVIVSLRHHYA